jgi:hypothetical protein
MRLQELFESRSADLYHGTTVEKLNRLLQDNVLMANVPIHNTNIPQQYKQYKKTVSLSRNPTVATNFARSTSFGDNGVDGIPVVLVLDQDKLHRALGKRMRPYNDMQSLDATYGDEDKVSPRSRGTVEDEEAIFGNINNINSFIKKIIVHMPKNAHKETVAEFSRYKDILNDPRTVVADFLNKNLTGRQFMDLVNKGLQG